MKYSFLSLLFLLIVSLASLNFQPPKKMFVPPGTVQVNDTLYFDETEMSYLGWREYVGWKIKTYGEDSPQHRNSRLDSLVWRKALETYEREEKHYHTHPAFNFYPVVGITWEQAVDYCKWKTEIVKEETEKGIYRKKILPQSFSYRLPTEAEWENVANAGYSEKVLKWMNSKKWKDRAITNVVRVAPPGTQVEYKPNPDATITAPVKSYFPNKLGVYNFIGNVAEMVSEKGIAKGGGWNHREKEITVEKQFPYEGAEAWLGFRCVCEVKWD